MTCNYAFFSVFILFLFLNVLFVQLFHCDGIQSFFHYYCFIVFLRQFFVTICATDIQNIFIYTLLNMYQKEKKYEHALPTPLYISPSLSQHIVHLCGNIFYIIFIYFPFYCIYYKSYTNTLYLVTCLRVPTDDIIWLLLGLCLSTVQQCRWECVSFSKVHISRVVTCHILYICSIPHLCAVWNICKQ